ncbi:hypothetical protein [Vulcanisaeta souniana]|uniref:Uncharacterized protein n=1 Tax=Vulcanisaeta souniana JCM 11219 TaxID=1293586 RepID=A0A830EFS2_9CREN|nr:hypothetical protein [Vulcanisaeta souniana]GGI67158.1 hypothetical protein GCM10007112_00170 [Vulcanisaeta souniana JCM 11219]
MIKYMSLINGLVYGIINGSVYVFPQFITTFKVSEVNGLNQMGYTVINTTCGDLVRILIRENGTLGIAWDMPIYPCPIGIECSNGRCVPMVNVLNDYAVVIYEAYNNNTGTNYVRLILINDSNGAVIYGVNITGISSALSSEMVNNTLVYPCGASLCGVEVMNNGTKLKFVINGLSGAVFNADNYGLVLTQNYNGVSIVRISGNGSVIENMTIPINLRVEFLEYCSRLDLMSNGIALLTVYPCSVSYGVYGYKELLAVINVTKGSVIHQVIRMLKIPIVNTPSPASIFPAAVPVASNNEYLAYYFNNQLFFTNEAQLINDWWYYILFDNTYLVMALWVITLIIIIATIINIISR